jgi:hypothetical protein
MLGSVIQPASKTIFAVATFAGEAIFAVGLLAQTNQKTPQAEE